MKTLRQAATDVIERWDAPLWKDGPATAVLIAALRKALEAPEQEPVATVQCINGVITGYLDVMQPVGTKLYAAQGIKELQAEGKGTAPCARFCEAKAFEIEIRQAEQGSQVLQAKCDAFFANTLLALEEIADLTKERDIYQKATDDWRSAYVTLSAHYDALLAAGKLALEALECSEAYVGCPAWSPSMLREVQETIAALKSAGVK